MTLSLARLLPCLAGLLVAAGAARAAPASGVPQPEQLAPGVYAVIGATDAASPANRGMVGNIGILVGTDGVILVDTGTSARQAGQLLEQLRAITPKPVVLAINTHQNPAFVFGNGTPQAAGVPIVAHQDTAALIAARCQRCLKLLRDALGSEEMAGTEVAPPTLAVTGSTTLVAGGRTIDLLYYGTTSAPGSIAVYDRESRTLFGGGLASLERLPDAKDADLGQWRAALSALQSLGAARVVPGEGPVAAPSRLAELDGYLAQLGPAVAAAFERRVSLAEAAAAAPVPAYSHWAQYGAMHGKNVEQLYLRLEKKALESP